LVDALRRRVLTTVAIYVIGAAAAVFAAVVVARDGQVAGATFAIAFACFFAACAVVFGVTEGADVQAASIRHGERA
jgi:hypothetical protein